MRQIGDMMKHARAPQGVGARKMEIDDKTLFFLAEKAVSALYGTRGRENIIPRYFRDGKLFFSCHSPLWAQELWVTRDAFRERLNREIGHDVVKEIQMSK